MNSLTRCNFYRGSNIIKLFCWWSYLLWLNIILMAHCGDNVIFFSSSKTQSALNIISSDVQNDVVCLFIRFRLINSIQMQINLLVMKWSSKDLILMKKKQQKIPPKCYQIFTMSWYLSEWEWEWKRDSALYNVINDR